MKPSCTKERIRANGRLLFTDGRLYLPSWHSPHVIVEEPNGRIHTIHIMLITLLEKGPTASSEMT
jgi:hypothetical protein